MHVAVYSPLINGFVDDTLSDAYMKELLMRCFKSLYGAWCTYVPALHTYIQHNMLCISEMFGCHSAELLVKILSRQAPAVNV